MLHASSESAESPRVNSGIGLSVSAEWNSSDTSLVMLVRNSLAAAHEGPASDASSAPPVWEEGVDFGYWNRVWREKKEKGAWKARLRRLWGGPRHEGDGAAAHDP